VQIVCLEIEPYLEEFVRPFFVKAEQGHKLDIRIGDAVASMKQLADEGHTFDVIFLDANKTGYMAYYNLVMENKMLAPSGFIVVDNALMKVCAASEPVCAVLCLLVPAVQLDATCTCLSRVGSTAGTEPEGRPRWDKHE